MSTASKRTRVKKRDMFKAGEIQGVLRGAMLMVAALDREHDLEGKERELVLMAHSALCAAWLHVANKK